MAKKEGAEVQEEEKELCGQEGPKRSTNGRESTWIRNSLYASSLMCKVRLVPSEYPSTDKVQGIEIKVYGENDAKSQRQQEVNESCSGFN